MTKSDWFESATAALDAGKPQETLNILDAAQIPSENIPQADRLRLLANSELGNAQKALETAQKILIETPQDLSIHHFLIKNLFLAERWEDAIQAAKALLKEASNDNESWRMLAVANYRAGLPEEGDRALFNAFSRIPLSTPLRHLVLESSSKRPLLLASNTATRMAKISEFSSAMALHNLAAHAAEIHPKITEEEKLDVLLDRESTIALSGDDEGAANGTLKLLHQAKIPLLRFKIMGAAGRHLLAAKRPQEARKTSLQLLDELKLCTEEDPLNLHKRHFDTLIGLAWISHLLGEFTDSDQRFKQAAAILTPEHKWLRAYLKAEHARALARRGEDEQASQWMESALLTWEAHLGKEHLGTATLRADLSHSQDRAGLSQKAIRSATEALRVLSEYKSYDPLSLKTLIKSLKSRGFS